MKKEISFYEFVGIIVPSITFLYFIQFIFEYVYQNQIVDFGTLGETIVFLVICYGFGHLLQALGNFFEFFLWFVYGGMPTKWLNNKNRFGNTLFDNPLNKQILDKVLHEFGDGISDYGRLTYNTIFLRDKTFRIDIFNGNYSLFRGLSVSFLLISIVCWHFFNWEIGLISLIPFLLSVMRMIQFAKYYATEIFRTFNNIE
jgi:hypothetical protein